MTAAVDNPVPLVGPSHFQLFIFFRLNRGQDRLADLITSLERGEQTREDAASHRLE